ncbi:hypothetical protein ASC95_14480 [Pelomonas sp. Root1217]|uniref:hypothetical protein n=1 Tax=Pelomonas sp. Root1217 TaxID=1736430 RepID=UPI00070F963B|nr:hypothetical protein [Pelomonas sp. Root1217]KQV50566.1 hypothetical protein ASC95_14480 [Pelomonas sp. Root1217]
MSTILYARLTALRVAAPASLSTTKEPPGVSAMLDSLAALVPAEILSAHALIIGFATKVEGGQTSITDAGALKLAFFALIVLSMALYVLARNANSQAPWVRLDYVRMCIPQLSFVVWTLLQRVTAFDAVAPAAMGGPIAGFWARSWD